VPSYPSVPSDFGLPNDPSRPVLFALSRAFVENFNAYSAVLTEAAALATQSGVKPDEAEIKRMMQTAVGSLEDVNELADWIYTNRRPLPFGEALSKAQVFQELGFDWVEQMLANLQKHPVGAPPIRRQSFIEAFEFMLRSKENSQGKATLRFCLCGSKHKAQCEQALKAGIRSLKKVLRKFAPELVSQYNALHPDRRKKVNG
jgi:hypothetical protein